MNGYVSKATFARIYGCKPSYITKLMHEKKLVLDTDGMLVNVEASFRLIEASRDLSKTGVRERWAAYRQGKDPENFAISRSPSEIAPAPAPSSAERSDYHNARADRERAEARLKELELRKQLAEVAEVAPMRKAMREAMAATHSAMRELPDRLAGLLAAETDAARCHDLLRAEVERIARALEQQAQAIARADVTMQ